MFFVQIITLSVILSRSIYIVVSGIIFFLLFFFFVWLNTILLCTYMYTHTHHTFFLHSCIDGHLGCFHILVIVHNIAVNTVVHASFQTSVSTFFGYIFRSGIAESYLVVFLVFLKETPYCFPYWLYQFAI